MKLDKLFKAVGTGAVEFCKKNGYIALGITAIAGLAGSIYLAYNARPKVDKIMADNRAKSADIEKSEEPEEVKEEKRKELKKETTVEVAKAVGPLAACSVVTIGCMGGTIAMAARKIDDLMSMVRMGDVAYNNLYQSAREVVGDEKADEIKMEATNKEVNRAPDGTIVVLSQEGFIKTGYGDVPFYDALTCTPFLCSKSAIEKAMNECNVELSKKTGKRPKISYNHFRHKIGLPDAILGENRFWTEPIIVNMANAFPWGEGSVRVLDFVNRPMIDLS